MKLIVVNCEENDIVDIKCGGPRYLGFDFIVNDNEVEEMTNFIKDTLKENNTPLISIYSTETTSTNLWTKEKIKECIKEGYN